MFGCKRSLESCTYFTYNSVPYIFHLQQCSHCYIYFSLSFAVDEFITIRNICTIYAPLRCPQEMAKTRTIHLHN
jgi:hypothetical protein